MFRINLNLSMKWGCHAFKYFCVALTGSHTHTHSQLIQLQLGNELMQRTRQIGQKLRVTWCDGTQAMAEAKNQKEEKHTHTNTGDGGGEGEGGKQHPAYLIRFILWYLIFLFFFSFVYDPDHKMAWA